MKVVADVKCYHCGHLSGEVIGRRDQPIKDWLFEPRAGEPRVAGPRLRCVRCEGPTYLEDVRAFVADDPVRAVRRRLAGLGSAA